MRLWVETSNSIANLFAIIMLLGQHFSSSSAHLILAGVNVAGHVAVTRIEWITRARNDAAVANGQSLGGSATGSCTPGLNPINRRGRNGLRRGVNRDRVSLPPAVYIYNIP